MCLFFFQRLVAQDIAFSSLFIKVIVEMLIWLDNPTVEGGPLKTLLKSFAGQNSHKHRHSDGKQLSSLTFQVFKCNEQRLIRYSDLQCAQVSSTWLRLWHIVEIPRCRWEPSLRCWRLETDVTRKRSSLEKVLVELLCGYVRVWFCLKGAQM